MPRGISIGIIGPEELVQRILNVLKAFPSFRPIAKTYDTVDEAPGLAEEIADEAEVILASGPVPYNAIREQVRTSAALHYVPLTDTGFYRALSRLKNALGPERRLRVSVDTLGKPMIAKALAEIDETRAEALPYDGPANASKEMLAAHHALLFESGACDAALTAEASVAKALSERGIPNEWIIPTDGNITVALERALLSTETRQSKEAQIVVGLINVDHFERLIQTRASEHEIQKFKLDIHRMLLDYVASLDGYLTHLGGDEYLFFTTRGIFERITGGYKSISLGRSMYRKFGLSLSIGMGFGRSANEAGTNARAALRKSKDAGGDTCFIVGEDRALIGPLAMSDPLEAALALTDAGLIKRAEDAGMTSVYLSKLMAQVARTGQTDYKVHELAAMLDITVRSTHRLLQQWLDHRLIAVADVEKVPKGRPRQIFRLTFLRDAKGG
ncbi:hypothetical protein GXP70_21045 [Paenibacillus lycopersici]|uniref:GGDEF domain-containing protein n=1 Tax=Paenibacillus lycopersici TaxID=2704462 RepID=A0A6C0G8G0_9BACL|nr:hypothetical protein GXP70_21045 [Paenibacillus lycopersici]